MAPQTASRWVAQLLPVVLAAGMMWPRLHSAQFGLFDDPTSIQAAERILHGGSLLEADVGRGRLRPLYWLSFAGIYSVAGDEPAWFFAGNLVLLAATAFLVARIARWHGVGEWGGALAGSVYVLSGPVVESSYTLSKPELLQALWLALSIATVTAFGWDERRGRRRLAVGLTSIWILLSAFTKETAVLLLPIAAVWWALAYLPRWRASPGGAAEVLVYRGYATASVVGLGVFLLLIPLLSPAMLGPGVYSGGFDLDPARLVLTGRAWIDWLNRDYFYLTPLIAVLVSGILARGQARRGRAEIRALWWMGAWVAVYVPWRFQVEYYLLPFALGASILVALVVSDLLELFRSSGRILRVLIAAGLVASAFLFGTTVANNASNARIQLAVDRANEEALAFVAERLPPAAGLLINIQNPNEYVEEIGVSLANRGRADLTLEVFNPAEGAAAGDYILSPIVENQPFPSVRLGVFQRDARQWEMSLLAGLEGRLERIYETKAATRLFAIDALRLFCPAVQAIRYCDAPHAPFDTRLFAHGWRIYRVLP